MKPEQQRIKLGHRSRVFADRFISKIKLSRDGCWDWTGAMTKNGYGQFWNGERLMLAHHFSMPDRPSMEVEACHKCDNSRCVNPEHLWWGTRSENMRDMVKKGRHNTRPGGFASALIPRESLGEANGNSKITNKDAAAIKAVRSNRRGINTRLAEHFGVSQTVISGIRLGSRWSTIEPDQIGCEALLKTLGLWKEE